MKPILIALLAVVSMFVSSHCSLFAEDKSPSLMNELKVAEDLFSPGDKQDPDAALIKMFDISQKFSPNVRIKIYTGLCYFWKRSYSDAEVPLIENLQKLLLELKISPAAASKSKSTNLRGAELVLLLAEEVSSWMQDLEKDVKKKDRKTKTSAAIAFDRKTLILGFTALGAIYAKENLSVATKILDEAGKMVTYSWYYFDDVSDLARSLDCYLIRSELMRSAGKMTEASRSLSQWEALQESWREVQNEKRKNK